MVANNKSGEIEVFDRDLYNVRTISLRESQRPCEIVLCGKDILVTDVKRQMAVRYRLVEPQRRLM